MSLRNTSGVSDSVSTRPTAISLLLVICSATVIGKLVNIKEKTHSQLIQPSTLPCSTDAPSPRWFVQWACFMISIDCPASHSFSVVLQAITTFCTLMRASLLNSYRAIRKLEETINAGKELALTISLPWTAILQHRSLAAKFGH